MKQDVIDVLLFSEQSEMNSLVEPLRSDWKGHNSDVIFNYVHNTKASGSIILLHE